MVASATALSLEQHVSSMCVYYCWFRKLIASSRVSLHPTTYFTHHLSIIVISTNYDPLVSQIHKCFRSSALYRTSVKSFLVLLHRSSDLYPSSVQISLVPYCRSSAVTRLPLNTALSKRVRCPFSAGRPLPLVSGCPLRSRTSGSHRMSGTFFALVYIY